MKMTKDWTIRFAAGLTGVTLIAIIGVSLYDSFRAAGGVGFTQPDRSPLALLFAGWLIWLGLMILIIYGLSRVASLMRNPSQEALARVYSSSGNLRAAQPCPCCENPVLLSWSHCPHCGETLEGNR
jgi:hypothetical protein